MHQARGIEVFVPGLERERGARLLFEKGEHPELGDGGGAVGNGESGEEGYYCFWRGGGGKGGCEGYHHGLRGGDGEEPHEPGVDAILSDSATSA